MGKLSKVLRNVENNGLSFQCPGCNTRHHIRHGVGQWTWNGDVDKPTFTPSVLVRYTKFTAKGEAELKQWELDGYPNQQGRSFDHINMVCHSFVTDGMIQFLGDCTHALVGQTVPLPELD